MPPEIQPHDPVLRAALRKASLRLIPLIALGYGTAYMDRVNISFASLSMNRDLHFSSTVYGFGAGLFFLAYAACEIPSNLILYRVGARRWLARIMVTWGVIAMGMLFVRTPLEFYVLRFLLGVAEAGFFPGIMFYLTTWFPAEYRARTVSRFYISLPLSSVLMGAIAGSLLSLDGRWSLAGWQWLFLLEGVPAVLMGVVFLLYLPDGPQVARWLTATEKAAISRSFGSDSAPGHGNQSVAAALRDPRVWQFGGFCLLMLAGLYAYTFSMPDIIQASTALPTGRVGYIVAGLNLLGAAAMLLGAISSDRSGERYWHVIVPSLVSAAAFVVCGSSNQPALVVPSLGVIVCCYMFMQGPLWALPPTFFTGRTAAAGIAAANMVGIVGGFLGPYAMGIAKDVTGTNQRGLSLFSLVWVAAAGVMEYMRRRSRQQPRTVASVVV